MEALRPPRCQAPHSARAATCTHPRRPAPSSRHVADRCLAPRSDWGLAALGTAAGLWTAAVARFLVPAAASERRPGARSARPATIRPAAWRRNIKDSLGVWVVNAVYRGTAADLRPARDLHPLGLHHFLGRGRGGSSAAPVTAAASAVDGLQLRRPRPAAAGTMRHPPGRRRPVGSRTARGRFAKNSDNGPIRPAMSRPEPTGKSQLWKSIFRHPAPLDRRGRIAVVLGNFFLHFHPDGDAASTPCGSASPGAWAASPPSCSSSRRSPACC